jgi:hypothetical protein
LLPRRVTFATKLAETRLLHLDPEEDREMVALGAETCDGCSSDFGFRKISPFYVFLSGGELRVKHSALLCAACRKKLTGGQSLQLDSLEGLAETLYRAHAFTLEERLKELEYPYTPKLLKQLL